MKEIKGMQKDFSDARAILGLGDNREFDPEIEAAYREIVKVAKPKWVTKEYPLQGRRIPETDLSLSGRMADEILEDATAIVLMAVTLGIQVDQCLRKMDVLDPTQALYLDAVASQYTEEICTQVNEQIIQTYRKKEHFLTMRFSPGYGDLPIGLNQDIGRLLDIDRQMGLKVNASGLMIPRKSVIALMGVLDQPSTYVYHRCSSCLLRFHCNIRKNGGFCGK